MNGTATGLNRDRITPDDIIRLFRGQNDGSLVKLLLVLVGVLLTPITLIGVVWFYTKSYKVHMQPKGMEPRLHNLPLITRVSMVLGGIVIWAVIFLLLKLAGLVMNAFQIGGGYKAGFYFAMLAMTAGVMAYLARWRKGYQRLKEEEGRYGFSEFGRREDFADLENTRKGGLYIGGGLEFCSQGHLCTFARTRGGKGTNLIIPNLLGKSEYRGSWVVIDPKGENAAITARYQEMIGQNVIKLNPWNL